MRESAQSLSVRGQSLALGQIHAMIGTAAAEKNGFYGGLFMSFVSGMIKLQLKLASSAGSHIYFD